MLTKGLDNIQGTSGNDTIIGSLDAGVELNTLSPLDIINGGAGVDTLKIADNVGAAIALPNVSNVEIIEVQAVGAANIDTSTTAGVTNLNVTKAAGAVIATAAATTDVNVAVKGIAGTTVTVNGGKDVTVTTTDAAAAIDVGATGTDPVGAVTITATSAAVANNANPTMGNIAVGGGKTVNVTQKVGDASAIVADGTTETVTQGNVTVTANATTTDVTIKQDAAVTAQSRAAVTGVTEVASVKFTKLDATESVTISGLTFTADKDLTAEQVAQAFANLSASAIKPTQIAPAGTATGDTNGGSASANGKFTGSLLADWTSGAATGDTVVFTGKANTAMTDLATTTPAKATVTTTTQGVTAVSAQNTLGVTNGTVTIAGAAALKTVTVDGYAASTAGAGITGGTNTALDTISLANGAGFEIDSAAATLGLTLTNVNGTVDVQAGTKTLNAAVSHAKATDTTTLASASAEAINVSGTGNVAGNTTAGLTAATAINTTGMTAGKATFTIANGTVTSYTGGAGADSVTVSNANVAITKAIDLGAGDDTLTLNVTAGTVAVPTATLKGGDGTDTIAMNGASAESLSANGTFAGKIEGFEKLHINDTVAAATTVNMANMDGITYVVSNNSSGAAVGEQQTFTLTKGTDAAVGEQQTMVITNGSDAAVSEQQTFTVTAATGAGTAVVMGVNVVIAGTEDQDGVGNAIVAQKAAIITANPTVADVTYAGGTVTITYTADAGDVGSAVVDDDSANTGITFGAVTDDARTYDSNAGNITFAGATIALTAGMTVDQVGAAIVAQEAAIKAATTTIDTVTYDDATDTVTVTYLASAGDVAVFTAADTDNVGFTAAATNDARPYDSNAGNITVAGATIAVTAGLTADQLGATIAANEAAIKAANSNVDTVTYDAATDKVTITYTTAAGAQAEATVVDTASVGINVGSFTESRAYAAAGAAPALTLDKMANNGTLELVAAGAGVVVKMADATGSTDSFNIVTKVSTAGLTFGTVDVAGVETLKLNAVDTEPTVTAGGVTSASIQTATLNLKADKATSLTIEGNSNVTLTLDAATTKLATIDASALTGNLQAGNTLNAVAMTITGGKGNDVLKASVGTNAKADVLNGGDGNDTLYAGSNGAKLTGGAGNDLFIVTANSATDGSKESNTYSEILDFQAGDLLQLQAFVGGATADVTGFTKLAAVLNENTAQFSDFVNAAIKEAGAGAAVYFNFKGDAYIAIDSATSTDAFVNGEDMVVKLTGINGDNLSWNSDYATVALI